VEPEIVRYLDDRPTPERLREIVEMLGLSASRLVRTGEKAWTDLGLDLDRLDDESLFQVLSENPVLIERPIVIAGDKARIGRPPEAVLELFEKRSPA